MLFKILWFIIKWALIIGIPGFFIAGFCASRDLYNKHRRVRIGKKAYITFKEFEKLYPVSADKWFFKSRWSEDYCLNSSTPILNRDDEDIYCLYFSNGSSPNHAWAAAEYFYTQMIFKTYRDFSKYHVWLTKREEAIKKRETFQQQKADLEAMEEVLRVVQADIDKIKKEADKKIEESLKTTIEVSARIKNADSEDAIQKLFEVKKERKQKNAGKKKHS